MSNFQCSECGMVNIDCGSKGYKTPREIEYENVLTQIRKILYESTTSTSERIMDIYDIINEWWEKYGIQK